MHFLRAISRGHKKTARKTISDRLCMCNDNNEFIRYKVFFSDCGSRIYLLVVQVINPLSLLSPANCELFYNVHTYKDHGASKISSGFMTRGQSIRYCYDLLLM